MVNDVLVCHTSLMTLESKESIFKLWGGDRGTSSIYVLEKSVLGGKLPQVMGWQLGIPSLVLVAETVCRSNSV